MIARIIEILSGFIVATISLMGYSGIVLLMAIESACIPLPSEIIMPFSGYLVSNRRNESLGCGRRRRSRLRTWFNGRLLGGHVRRPAVH